jgi:hypothetical protein
MPIARNKRAVCTDAGTELTAEIVGMFSVFPFLAVGAFRSRAQR